MGQQVAVCAAGDEVCIYDFHFRIWLVFFLDNQSFSVVGLLESAIRTLWRNGVVNIVGTDSLGVLAIADCLRDSFHSCLPFYQGACVSSSRASKACLGFCCWSM